MAESKLRPLTKLAAWRKARNMDQTELGEMLNISHQYVCHLEKGRRRPNIAMMRRIMEVTHNKLRIKDLDPELYELVTKGVDRAHFE